MLIKYKGKEVEITAETIKSWRGIQTQIAIIKAKRNTKERKAIKAILSNRELIAKYINKNDEELKGKLAKTTAFDLDRRGMKGAKFPFKLA